MKKIPELDGLRGVAIVLVLACHLQELMFFGSDGSTLVRILSRVLTIGWFGVDVFFVLSGFLITSTLLSAKHEDLFWRDFYTKRAFRILPAFTIVFCATILFVHSESARTILLYVFFLANWTILNYSEIKPLTHVWSLAVEEQFYLLWPLAVRKLKEPTLLRLALSIAGLSCFFRVALALGHVNPYWLYKITPTRLDGLAVGAAVAISIRLRAPLAFLARHNRRILIGAIALWLGGFIVCGFSCFAWDSRAQIYAIPAIVVLTASTIFMAVQNSLSPGVQTALKASSLSWFGRRSYMIYLVHEPLHQGATKLLQEYKPTTLPMRLTYNTVATTFVLVLSLLLAELSWKLIEERAISLARSITAVPGSGKQDVGPGI